MISNGRRRGRALKRGLDGDKNSVLTEGSARLTALDCDDRSDEDNKIECSGTNQDATLTARRMAFGPIAYEIDQKGCLVCYHNGRRLGNVAHFSAALDGVVKNAWRITIAVCDAEEPESPATDAATHVVETLSDKKRLICVAAAAEQCQIPGLKVRALERILVADTQSIPSSTHTIALSSRSPRHGGGDGMRKQHTWRSARSPRFTRNPYHTHATPPLLRVQPSNPAMTQRHRLHAPTAATSMPRREEWTPFEVAQQAVFRTFDEKNTQQFNISALSDSDLDSVSCHTGSERSTASIGSSLLPGSGRASRGVAPTHSSGSTSTLASVPPLDIAVSTPALGSPRLGKGFELASPCVVDAPSPEPKPEKKAWFYKEGPRVRGPLTASALRDLVGTKALPDTVLVWEMNSRLTGPNAWAPFRDVAEKLNPKTFPRGHRKSIADPNSRHERIRAKLNIRKRLSRLPTRAILRLRTVGIGSQAKTTQSTAYDYVTLTHVVRQYDAQRPLFYYFLFS